MAANDGDFTASAFTANKVTVPPVANIDALMGTATYSGTAAGKYVLTSSTGGTNGAGHFTADTMLEANFNDDTITGTIDNFLGADGMSRELKTSAIETTGGITGTTDDAATGNQMTAWSIGGAAAAGGEWNGTLHDNSDDGVPSVATGTFHSLYDTAGRMVGAFGANDDEPLQGQGPGHLRTWRLPSGFPLGERRKVRHPSLSCVMRLTWRLEGRLSISPADDGEGLIALPGCETMSDIPAQ